jgi:hypothetical protein
MAATSAAACGYHCGMSLEAQIGRSVAYLGSAKALHSLEAHCYWPKWHSPWWHMLLLHEMGETTRIPEIAVTHLIESLNRLPIRIFPIHPGELPEGASRDLDSACHCQLGSVYGLLATWGVDVDKQLPWIRPWFPRYQMADGGLNCDDGAYRVHDECASSMVGTIAAFEAILLHTQNTWSDEEKLFLDRCARFLVERKLMLGSNTKHNAEERAAAPMWLQPCFPRFYFYDVLRGLNALVLWAEQTSRSLDRESIQPVLDHLEQHCPDGVVRVERRSFARRKTLQQSATGEWSTVRQAATVFPLLTTVSEVGEVSPYLSWQWETTKRRLADLTA